MVDSHRPPSSFPGGSVDPSSGTSYVQSSGSAAGVVDHLFDVVRGSLVSPLSLVDISPVRVVNVPGLIRIDFSASESVPPFVFHRFSACPGHTGGMVGVVDRGVSFCSRLFALGFSDLPVSSPLPGSSVSPSGRAVAGGCSLSNRFLLGSFGRGGVVPYDTSPITSDLDSDDGSEDEDVSYPFLSQEQRSATEYCASCRRRHSSAEPLQLCSGCFWVGYCGLECQRLNWLSHRFLCSYLRYVSADPASLGAHSN
jgi:hypothetical protein